MKYGFERLREQLNEYTDSEWGWQTKEVSGDTPIEKLLLWALKVVIEARATEYRELLVFKQEYAAKVIAEGIPAGAGIDSLTAIIVVPQMKIGDRIVDFMVYASSGAVWRELIVECDGHDFHERTKAQVARDRSKDRTAILQGVDQFRFTGSEIWRDPWGCATQNTDWAIKGWDL